MQILNCESSGKQEQDYDYNMNKKRSLCDLTGLLALDGKMDGRTYGWTNVKIDGHTNGQREKERERERERKRERER